MSASTFSSPVAVALARGAPPDDNRWLDIVVPEILLFVLATVAVFARLYVRLSIKPKLWLDDYTMFAAYAWTFFGFVTIIMQAQYGLGRHTIYIGKANAIQMMKWNQLARLTFIPCVALIKVSICFFLLRILDSRTHAHFRTYIWLVMAASVGSNIVLLVIWAMQCIPIEATWDPTVEGQCLSQKIVVDVAYVQGGFNLVTDILCALFPVFFFNTAYMRWKTRGALILLAILGMLTSVTAVLRIVYLPDLEQLDDSSWILTNVTICALIETKAGIFLGCLPAIKCLWTKFFEILPFHFARRNSNVKSWDRMSSPIMPRFDSSSSLHSGDRDSLPLQPLQVDRANQLAKGFGVPPDTPGLQESEVKVTSFV